MKTSSGMLTISMLVILAAGVAIGYSMYARDTSNSTHPPSEQQLKAGVDTPEGSAISKKVADTRKKVSQRANKAEADFEKLLACLHDAHQTECTGE